MQDGKQVYKIIELMPKVELHVHFEGSIMPQTLLILAERNNVNLPAKNIADLTNFFKFKNFRHFVEVYTLVTSCFKTPADYEFVAYQFGYDRARQNILYSEVTFSLAANCRLTGLHWDEILHALNSGRERAKKDFNVDWGWIFDILRDEPDSQDWIVDAAIKSRDVGVVAVGLSGNEDAAHASDFSNSVLRARANGLGFVPHAGETCGPESIWAVIDLLHADRVGHGIRCVEDPMLMDFLKQKQIPLEICPSSNICIGVYPNFKSHPLKNIFEYGLCVTINSDDQSLFNADLCHEIELSYDVFDFSLKSIETININAVRANFLPNECKLILEQKLKQFWAAL